MSDPFTTALSMGGSLLGGILQGVGQSQTIESEATARQYQSYVHTLNAQIAQQNALAALARGQQDAATVGRIGAARMGSIRAAQGASGLDVGSKTSADVRGSQAELTRLAELNTMDEANMKAYNFALEAKSEDYNAQIAAAGASNLRSSKDLAMASSLLGGATSFASKWSDAKRLGVY